MKINTPGRQIQITPRYRNPANIISPAAQPQEPPDNTLGNIAAIMGASSDILANTMRVADAWANSRASKVLPDMFEEAGRVFDEMESYDGDDFNEVLSQRLEEVHTDFANEYGGLTRQVIDAKWGQWRSQRVDQFETAISQRNREQEYNGIIAEMKNPETSPEAFNTYMETLVDKAYHAPAEAAQIAGEILSEKFVDKQIAEFANSNDPNSVVELLAQNEDGSWAVQFEDYDANTEERHAIVEGAGQLIQARIDAEKRALNERSQGLFNTWRARWAQNPGSISINDARRALDGNMLNSEHYNWWISRIEGWMADQQRQAEGGRDDLREVESDRAKNLLYAMVPELMNEGLSSYTIESLVMKESQKMGFGNELAQDVMDDFRAQMDDLEGNRMLNNLVEPLDQRAKDDPNIYADISRIKNELRSELQEKGTITDAMRARVNAELLRIDGQKVEEQLERSEGAIRAYILSQWDQPLITFRRGIKREEDMQTMEPIERVIAATSWGGLDYLQEVAPQRAEEVRKMSESVRPILDNFFRHWSGDREAVGEMDPTTGMITYTKSDGTRYRPVVKNNVASFERIGVETNNGDLWDFMDDLRVELGMYLHMAIREDGYIYGVSSSTGRDGRPEATRLRRATATEMSKFLSLGGSNGRMYPTRRFDAIMDLKYE